MKMEKICIYWLPYHKRAKSRGKGISVNKVDGDNWELVQILEGQVKPSYLCLNKSTGPSVQHTWRFLPGKRIYRSGKMVP